MQDEQDERPLNRRRLLRQAGTVVAGVAGATVVGAVVASPAEATNGDDILVGGSYSGTSTTTLSINDSATPALTLVNADPTGAPLALSPIDFDTAFPGTDGPVGSLFADDWGDFYGIGNPDGGGKYVNLLYSPTWASMTIPVAPFRVLDTRPGATIVDDLPGRTFVVDGSASYDSAGRVIANGGTATDLVLDLSIFIAPPGPAIGAAQMNLTVVLGSGAGFAAVWGEGTWPGTSSINFVTGTAIANFVQSPVDTGLATLSFKVSKKAALIVDLVGFIVSDSLQLFAAAGVRGARASNGRVRRRPAPAKK